VTILVRGNTLVGSMSRYLSERIEASENVRFRFNAAVGEFHGGDSLEEIVITDTVTNEPQRVPTRAVFCFIGAEPRTQWLGDVLQLDSHGYILSGPNLVGENGRRPKGWLVPRDPQWLETSIAGIFVVGDVRLGSIKRIASAIGEGAMTISFVHLHLRSPEIASRPKRPDVK
jgi:thioredoxin reductase (NADPH)